MTELNNIASHTWDETTKLFSQTSTPIAIWNGKEMRCAFVNNAYQKIFSNTHIAGKTVMEAFPTEKSEELLQILLKVFDTGLPAFETETPAQTEANNNGAETRYYNFAFTSYKNENIEGVMAFGSDVTEQVKTRKKESEDNERFRRIVEQSSDPILILKGENMVLDMANKALLQLWNVTSEALGKPFLEILPEMKDQGFFDILSDVYKKGITHYGHETKSYFQRPNGEKETHYFNFIYQPYRENDNTISGVLILATDVTEKVVSNQKFLQSEHNFQNLVMQAPVAMCVLKGENLVMEIANQLMYEICGRPKAEVWGKPLFEALPEVKDQGIEALMNDVLKTGIRITASERPVQLLRTGKMETTYINFVYEPYREGNDKITGIIIVATDVTEQVLSRQKTEYAIENARLAIDSADLGTYEVNLQTSEMQTSKRFNDIWGLEKASQKREDYAAIIHPDYSHIRIKAHQQALISGNLMYEARLKRNDGSQCWIKVKGKVLFDNEKKPVRILGVIQDITEQKVFAEELSKKVQERTKELKETNQRLENSNENLEQFAYIASHDLQEPLRKIHLFSSLVLDQPEINENSRKYIEKIGDSAKRLGGLIKDLLEYSQLSQKNLRFEKTDLNAILGDVLIDFELLISQKNAIVKAGELPQIETIPLQMNQLFYNLVGNALKFSKRNETPVITITAKKVSEERKKDFKQLEPDRDYTEINISDNGIGFNEEYASKIFTIFQRLNEKSQYGGYGIGLALCRKIVENLSGVIYAEGRPREGASFIFILPYQQN